jgi:hypothetical protein
MKVGSFSIDQLTKITNSTASLSVNLSIRSSFLPIFTNLHVYFLHSGQPIILFVLIKR